MQKLHVFQEKLTGNTTKAKVESRCYVHRAIKAKKFYWEQGKLKSEKKHVGEPFQRHSKLQDVQNHHDSFPLPAQTLPILHLQSQANSAWKTTVLAESHDVSVAGTHCWAHPRNPWRKIPVQSFTCLVAKLLFSWNSIIAMPSLPLRHRWQQ